MESAATAAAKRSRAISGTAVRPAEFRAALEQALAAADADERIGPLLRATKLRLRLEFTDTGQALNLATAEGDRNLEWSFAEDPGWTPKLRLAMDSAVANRYLQGRENLAIAIARGKVEVSGESRAALFYLPATRMICERYRGVVETDHPALVA